MILPKAAPGYSQQNEQDARHTIEQEDKFNIKFNRLGGQVATLLAGQASGTGGPAGTGSPGFSGGISIDLTSIPGGVEVAGVASSNYALDFVAKYQRVMIEISWVGGFALVWVDGSTTPRVIYSSNSLGGNACFDTTNGVSSNGGNGIAFIVSGGITFIQTKNSYTGGAVRIHRFGG